MNEELGELVHAARDMALLLGQSQESDLYMRLANTIEESDRNIRDAMFKPTSAVCRETNCQCCNICEDANCGDNTTPSIVALRARLAEAERELSAAKERLEEYEGGDRYPQVSALAFHMRRKLNANSHKGGWSNCDLNYLRSRLREEVDELVSCSKREEIAGEAADVANFAMMLADVQGALLPAAEKKEVE